MADRDLELAMTGRTDAIRVRAMRRFAGRLDKRATPLATALRAFFRRTATNAIRRFRSLGPSSPLFSLQTMSQVQKQAMLRGQVRLRKAWLRKSLTDDDFASFRDVIRLYGTRRMNSTGRTVARGLETEWEIRPEEVEDFFNEKTVHLQNFMETARLEFESITQDVVTESLTAEPRGTVAQAAREIFDRITTSGGPFSPERAMVVARTEIAQAENFGIYRGMNLAGVKRIRWLSIADNRRRDSHGEMHNKTVKVGTRFVLPSGVQMYYPCDHNAMGPQRAVAAEIIQCRCVVIPAAVRL